MNLSLQIRRNEWLGCIRLEILSNVFIRVQWSVNMQIPVKFWLFLGRKKTLEHKHQARTPAFPDPLFLWVENPWLLLARNSTYFSTRHLHNQDPPLKTKLKHILSMSLKMAGIIFIVLEKMQSTKELTLRKYN